MMGYCSQLDGMGVVEGAQFIRSRRGFTESALGSGRSGNCIFYLFFEPSRDLTLGRCKKADFLRCGRSTECRRAAPPCPAIFTTAPPVTPSSPSIPPPSDKRGPSGQLGGGSDRDWTWLIWRWMQLGFCHSMCCVGRARWIECPSNNGPVYY
ncbi:hypothetical protein BO71DRAFT_76289 [Aspergillus ellipticus CBS 707.79]|uniref:Uncharacterized protein n=1 Tax=Aspergillus ellipticus CBS 707.79 TaxID=1448320 RepID=A0A319D782_9EURO|nr:hypothetical protein BO71DRAFT_76289 [Aspergillus ellipticus CBS 707.79]